MLYQQVELLNFEDVLTIEGRSGVLLQRVPEVVNVLLEEETSREYRKAACGEIRFVRENSEPTVIALSSYGGSSRATLYFGDFKVNEFILDQEPMPIRIEPLHPWLLNRQEIVLDAPAFSVQVCRLILHGNEIHLHDIHGDVRPPRADEIPERKYLAYGTSITYGINASMPDITYVRQVGRRMGMDVLNLGAAGAANCEKELADYIAARNDWDIASLCISINMLNQGKTISEFQSKASYMVRTIAKNNPDKPVICIGLFPNFADFGLSWPERSPQATSQQYRDALREVAAQSNLANLHYVDGSELLTRIEGLSHDLLHPGDFGMIEIGEKLAGIMKTLIKGQG